MTKGPLELVGQVAEMLDELGIAYALGGSMANSTSGSMPLVPQSTHTLRSISSIPRTV